MATIFLTGATGFLGHYTLAELLSIEDVRVRILLAAPLDDDQRRLARLLADIDVDLAAEIRAGRVEPVEGRLPDGFDADSLHGIDAVLHVAASTRFRTNADGEPYRSNVDGTRALLDFAERSGIDKFILVSTAFVGGLVSGVLPEAPLVSCHASANDYERSKWLAEKAVLDWCQNRAHSVVVRPPILIGDVATGRTTNYGGVFTLARAVEMLALAAERDPGIDRRRIPLRIVGSPEDSLNIAPVCWIARHLARIATRETAGPRVINLVNPVPPTADDIRCWLEHIFDLAGGRFTDDVWPWPNASGCEEAFYAAGDSVSAYFGRKLSIETAYLASRGEAAPLVDASLFKKSIEFARRKKWGRASPVRLSRSANTDAIDPAVYFEEFMPSRLPQSSLRGVDGLTAVVRYIIDDTDDGEWVCRYEAGRLVEMHRGQNGLDEEFGFRVRRGAFEELVTGRQSLQTAYFQSEVEILGNTLMALKMVPIIDAFLHEHPVPSDFTDDDLR